MKTLSRTLSVLALACVMAISGWAQATLRSTTLSAAVNATQTTITVASATGITTGMSVWVKGGMELMEVTAISSTTLTVRRGQNGTQSHAHASAAVVYIDLDEYFNSQPFARGGACTSTAEVVLPQVNTRLGNIYDCKNSLWVEVAKPPTIATLSSGNGATVTLTAADCGGVFLFDRAAGIVYTLPAPVPGCNLTFVATVTVTSNAHKISTGTQGTDWILGYPQTSDADSGDVTVAFPCNGTSHDNFSMNGTTTGGLLGTNLQLTAVSATVWAIEGTVAANGTVATSCSTS